MYVCLQVFILDKSIEDKVVDGTESAKWSNLGKNHLTLPQGGQPSQTALTFHAKRAFKYAVQHKWCTEDELPSLSYGDLELMLQSARRTQEDLMLVKLKGR